ncbi:MAG: ArgE/DapE family deacylase [Nitrospinota bacterium]
MDAALLDEAVELTRDLVRIPSENPTGTEARVADWLEGYLRTLGLPVERDRVAEGRENLITEIAGAAKEPALVFLNHMDTVPAGEGWTRHPFAADLAEGKLWGRGACDMKGGLAAALVALKALKGKADRGARPRRGVRCCLVVDEESAWMQGAAAVVERGRIGARDIVLACEPTRMRLVTAQKGAMWYEVLVAGRSAHASVPHAGADALLAAARTVLRLHEAAAALQDSDPLLGKTTIVASVIAGGRKTNIVADRCRIEADVRFVPPLGVAEARGLVERAAAAACRETPGTSAQVRAISVDRPPILSDLASEGGRILARALREGAGLAAEPAGVSYYSDAGLAAARTGSRQCFLLGPGNVEQAHGPDEFVDVEELRRAALVFGRLTERFALDAG